MNFIAQLAFMGIQEGVNYAIEKDRQRIEEENQRRVDEYFAKQNAFLENDARLHELGIQREQMKREDKQRQLAEENKLVQGKNVGAQQQLLDQRRQLVEEERLRQAQKNQARLQQEAQQYASKRQQIANAEISSIEKKFQAQRDVAEQRNAIMRQDIDKLTNMRLQQDQQRQQQADEVRRLQQQAIQNEVMQRMETPQTQTTTPVLRQVAKARTTITTRRGRGKADDEVLQYLTKTLKMPLKDAHKVLDTYF
jgi:hypothetical protein